MTFASGTVSVSLPPNLLGQEIPTINHWQNRNVTEDGTARVYNRSVNEWFIPVRIKITNTQRSNLRNFFKNTVQFANSTFTCTPDTGVDMGAGVTTAVTVRYWQESLVERSVGGGIYETSFVLRTVSTGTSNPT